VCCTRSSRASEQGWLAFARLREVIHMAAACSAQLMVTNPVRSDSHLKNLRRRNNGGMFQCGKCLDWLSLSVSSWSPMLLRMRRQRPPKGRPVNKTRLRSALTPFPIGIGCALVCARTCGASVRSAGARCNAPVRTPQENATRHEARRLRCSGADRFAFCRTSRPPDGAGHSLCNGNGRGALRARGLPRAPGS
jgi:hypothetical protein